MTRREKIENVLRREGVIPGFYINKDSWHKLADALLAATKPDEGELEIIFKKFGYDWDSAINPRRTWVGHPSWTVEKLYDLFKCLKQWASGEEEKPEWCGHIIFDDKYPTLKDRCWLIPSGWKYCPICSKPRPE